MRSCCESALVDTGRVSILKPTIHSPAQMEHFKNHVDDKSIHAGGKQVIITPDGYAIPLSIRNGLPRFQELRPFTDLEWATLPHVFLTSEDEWTPSCMDYSHEDNEMWFDALDDLDLGPDATDNFDMYGNYKHRVEVQAAEFLERHPEPDDIDFIKDHATMYHAMEHLVDRGANMGCTGVQTDPVTYIPDLDEGFFFPWRDDDDDPAFYDVHAHELEGHDDHHNPGPPPEQPRDLEVPPTGTTSCVTSHNKQQRARLRSATTILWLVFC